MENEPSKDHPVGHVDEKEVDWKPLRSPGYIHSMEFLTPFHTEWAVLDDCPTTFMGFPVPPSYERTEPPVGK